MIDEKPGPSDSVGKQTIQLIDDKTPLMEWPLQCVQRLINHMINDHALPAMATCHLPQGLTPGDQAMLLTMIGGELTKKGIQVKMEIKLLEARDRREAAEDDDEEVLFDVSDQGLPN